MSWVQFPAVADNYILVIGINSISLIVLICSCRLKICNIVQGLCVTLEK